MVHFDLVWMVPFDQLSTFWQNGSVCHTCCMFCLWLGTVSLYGATSIHTGDTESTIFAANGFESIQEGVGFFEPVGHFPWDGRSTVQPVSSIPLACFSLLSRALAFVSILSSIMSSSLRAYLLKCFDVQF